MATYIKKGKSETELKQADANVKEIVSGIIKNIEANGDAAVKELSTKFDKWTPEKFRLTESEIAAIMDSVPHQVIDDIKFAQQQIRNFATKQRASIQDIEYETLP